MRKADEVFGELTNAYMPILDRVIEFLKCNTFEYSFVENAQYEQLLTTDYALGFPVYWREILLRAHMAATTSLLRSQSWLRSICQSVDDDNAIAFSACFRGFLEAASDTFDALGTVPEGLVNHRQDIIGNLTGQDCPPLMAEELENQLIHFLMAREVTKEESAPATHQKKQAAEYFATLDKKRHGPVRELYRELCELSHPSMASVSLFLRPEVEGKISLDTNGGAEYAAEVIKGHNQAVKIAFYNGINVCLMTLKVLNEFPLEQLHTPLFDSFFFDNMPLGERIRVKLMKERW